MNKKFLACLFGALLLAFSFISCNNLEKTNENNEDSLTNKDDEKIPSEEIPEVEILTVDYSIKYYDVVEDKTFIFSSTAEFENEIDPEFFIEQLSDLMQMKIDINSVKIDEKAMTVDFSSLSAPLNGTGSYEESFILESICETMFDVFPDIDEIYFTADGKDYESGHISLSKETPYEQR